MSKSIGTILKGLALQVGAPIVGNLIGGPIGAYVARGLVLAGGVTIVAGANSLIASILTPSQRSEQAENAIKAAVPPRSSGYGIQRSYIVYLIYVTSSDGYAVDVGAFHDGRIDSVVAYYLGDKKITVNESGFVAQQPDGQFGDGDTVQIGWTLGPAVNTAFAAVVAKLPGVWTTDHRGDGIVTGFVLWKPVKTKNFSKVYSGGGPNQMPLSLVMKMQPVFDWRDPTQSVSDPLTWKWSENAILHLAHYLLVRDNKSWDIHFAPTLAYWTAAADVCDEAVPLKDGGTEARYRGCVVHKHTDEHKAVVASLLACCDGWMSPRADMALVVYAGRYSPPSVNVDDRDVISYSVQDGIEEENAVNTIPLSYVSALHDYNTVDTDPWVDEDDIERRGKELASSGLANQVPSHAQARRLAKRAFAEAMAGKRGTCSLRSTGRKILGQRYIRLLLPEIGFDEVVQVKAPVKRDPTTGQVSFSWVLADPNADAWNPVTEEGDPAPVGNVIATEPLETPTIISATATYSAVGTTPEGEEPVDPTPGQTATGARVLIAATGPDRADVTWFARWRVGISGSWNEREYADADPGPAVSFTTEFVPLASNINVEVAYSVGDGRLSDWSDPTVVNTTTG